MCRFDITRKWCFAHGRISLMTYKRSFYSITIATNDLPQIECAADLDCEESSKTHICDVPSTDNWESDCLCNGQPFIHLSIRWHKSSFHPILISLLTLSIPFHCSILECARSTLLRSFPPPWNDVRTSTAAFLPTLIWGRTLYSYSSSWIPASNVSSKSMKRFFF